MITRDRQAQEAIARMKLWGIFQETINQFEKEGLISESAPPFGACFWLKEEQMARVQEFESQYNAVVYHVIHSYTTIGEMESLLFVCQHEEEWEMDREGIARQEQLAYVINLDDQHCNDMGYIGVELTPAAGLARTW